jgi:plasmid stabilization system protein ParE
VTHQLIVRRQAKADIRRAAQWYEAQRSGLGRAFLRQIDALLERVRANPMQHQAVYREVRRAIPRRFPYGVFYRIERADVLVFAVVHLHRDPPPGRIANATAKADGKLARIG